MAEARDRRARADDIAEVYIRRMRSRVANRNVESSHVDVLEVYIDQPEESTTPRTALRRGMGTNGAAGEGSNQVVRRVTGRGAFGTPRVLQGRSFTGSPAFGNGIENVFPGGSRGRASGSILPSWYPRRPLQDITSVVRAIERRRARIGEDEGQSSQSPIPASTTHFEHDISMITPKPTSSRKPFPCSVLRVPKILLDITNENNEVSEFLTPQKKLLNSIDTVEKVVMEELNKLKRTPTARKAEREKRVRTLLSMR